MFGELPKSRFSRKFQMIPSSVLLEADSLLLPRVRPEHEMRVPPRRLGSFHLEGVVVATVGAQGGATFAIAFGESAKEAASESGAWGSLEAGNVLLLLSFMGILDDGMTVEWGSEVNLEDGGELVGVDEVNDGDGSSHQEAKHPGNKHQPKTPTKVEGQRRLFEAYDKGSCRKVDVVDSVDKKESKASQGE